MLIENRERAKQLIDFSGVILGGKKAYPTDIDGFIEWKDQAYVIIEMKYGNAYMEYGQELALKRLVDDLQRVKPALLIIARHDTPKSDDVDMASGTVTKYRYQGKWYFPESLTVRNLVDGFIEKLA